MKILLCIDDTDMLGGKGTGKLMEELAAHLSGYMDLTSGFVSRHQLFVHEDIPFTSHNSAMCREVTLDEENVPLLIELSKLFLEGESAPGSDPGLCVILEEKLTRTELVSLISFGHRAKREVLTKRMAYALAERSEHVYLSEHGGTGQGIIGALAGCGLRLGGSDGRVKGKITPENPDEVLTVEDLCKRYGFHAAVDTEEQPVDGADSVICGEAQKAIHRNNRKFAFLVPDESGRAKWRPLRKEEWKRY